MAKIPQDIPNQNPESFLGYSKSIEQPKVDETLSSLFKNIGSTIENVAKSGDMLFKQSIQDNLQKDIDPERQKWIDTLGQMKADTRASGAAQVSANGMDAMAQASPDDVPDDISGVGDQVANLQAARQGGKISPTNYWLQLDSIAKDYRSRYPGYRDYIDQQISSITGHTPANAAFQSIMGDLNAALTNGKKEDPNVTQTRTALFGAIKDGLVSEKDQPMLFAKLATGDFLAVSGYVQSKRYPKAAFDAKEIVDKSQGLDDKSQARIAHIALNDYMTDKAWGDFNGNLKLAGKSMVDIQDEAKKFALDPSTADPKNVDQLYAIASGILKQSQFETTQFLNGGRDAKGMSRAQVAVGPTGDANKWINDNMKERYAVFQNMLTSLRDKDLPAAAMWAEQMQSQATHDRYQALNDPDMGPHLRNLQIIKDDPKDVQEYMKNFMPANYGSASVNAFYKRRAAEFLAQPDKNNGNVVTVDMAIKRAQAAGVESPQLYKDFAELGKNIVNKNLSDDKKYNLAAAMFHPDNQKFLSNFKEDQTYTDAQGNQRTAPGKYAVWDMYTNPLMASEVARLGETRPEIKKWYKDWVESGFGNDVFGPQVRNLSTIAADNRVKIVYDNIDNQLHMANFENNWDNRYAAGQQRRAGVTGNIEGQIDKLNQGLSGLVNLQRSQGVTDPAQIQGYILQQLKGLGVVAPVPTVRPDPRTVSEQIGNAIVSVIKGFNPLAGKSQDQVPRGR